MSCSYSRQHFGRNFNPQFGKFGAVSEYLAIISIFSVNLELELLTLSFFSILGKFGAVSEYFAKISIFSVNLEPELLTLSSFFNPR